MFSTACYSTRTAAGGRISHQCRVSRSRPFTAPRPAQLRKGGRYQPLRAAADLKTGPQTAAPAYEEIDKQPFNTAIMNLFRSKLVLIIGEDSPYSGYDGIMDLIRRFNQQSKDPKEVQAKARRLLQSLFPSWLLQAFQVMFARPFPEFSYKLNAIVTALTSQWLMGPSKVNDVEINGQVYKGQGVLIERCRFLEESRCASICINSCKVPTQTFFEKDFGLDVTLTPNYEDFSCQFTFGQKPLPEAQDEAFRTPCFTQCPTKRRAAVQPENCHRIDV